MSKSNKSTNPFRRDFSKVRVMTREESSAFYQELDENRVELSDEVLSGERQIVVALPDKKQD